MTVGADQLRGARNPILPIESRFFLARPVRLPNSDASVGRRGGEVHNGARGPGL